MSSDEACSVLQESKDGLRRSKRIMKSNKKQSKRIKHAKKSSFRVERTQSNQKLVEKKTQPWQDPEDSLNTFVDNSLTREELQQLWMKYTRDGHFRLNLPQASPPSLVISRISDGNMMTTKIECFETEKKLARESASTFISNMPGNPHDNSGCKKTNIEARDDPSSVTFSTPLTNVSSEPILRPNIINDRTQNSVVGNTIQQNSFGPNTNTFPGSSHGIPRDAITFLPPARPQFVTLRRRINTNPSYVHPACNAMPWNPLGRMDYNGIENLNYSNSEDYLSGNNVHQGFRNDITNTQEILFQRDNPYGNQRSFISQPINNLCNTSTSSNVTCDALNSAQNSSIYGQNQSSANSTKEWNSVGQITSNTFTGNNIPIPLHLSTSLNSWTQRAMNYIPPCIVPYNLATNNNSCVYPTPTSPNYSINTAVNTSGNYVAPNAYDHFGRVTFEATPATQITKTQIKSWTDKPVINQGSTSINDTSSSAIANNSIKLNTNSVTSMTNTNSQLLHISNQLSDNQKTAVVHQENSQDSQGSGLSASSYGTGTSYDKYMAGNSVYNNDNIIPQCLNYDLSSSLLGSIKDETWMNISDDYSEYNNDSIVVNRDSTFYDFNSKNESDN